MGSPGGLADVMTSALCSNLENNMWCIPVYGRKIPMVSSPGEADSVSAEGIFLHRTMGLPGDLNCSISASVGSAYFSRESRSLAITANGFCFLPYHSLRSSILSRVQQMCIPPHPWTTALFPSSRRTASFPIGSSEVVPSLVIRRYEGPHAGQAMV